MGPRSFDRGNNKVTHETEAGTLASMGPRSFDRGNQRHVSAEHAG